MIESGHLTKLKLSVPPMSNYDFIYLRTEENVQQLLDESMLYIIAQRSTLSFENITKSDDSSKLYFEIAQAGTIGRLICVLPIHQKELILDPNEDFVIDFGSYNKNWEATNFPLNNVDGIKFYDANENLKAWLSPGKFIHHYLDKAIRCEVLGDVRPFLSFKIHYVGKSTDQDIWKRLGAHATLQKILSLEVPFNYGTLPTHEINLLFFQVSEALTVNVFGGKDEDIDRFTASIFGSEHPSKKEISLDAEKALIKVLSPDYNIQKFRNYPKSKDGLYKFNYDRFLYHIAEDLTLVQNDVQIFCSINENESDFIAIDKNTEVEIIKYGESI